MVDADDPGRRSFLTRTALAALLVSSPWFAHAFPRREGEHENRQAGDHKRTGPSANAASHDCLSPVHVEGRASSLVRRVRGSKRSTRNSEL